jgi:predicted ATPase/DNA-binding winged helix-turn-helix (wHTH) protein
MTKNPMSRMPALYFGPYRLVGPRGPLWREGDEVPLRPKTLEVLWYLATHGGEVVDHDHLLAAIWPKTIVSEGTLAVSIRELRRALGDDPRNPRYIQTMHRRGYRFVAPILPVMPIAMETAATDAPVLLGRAAELEQMEECFARACAGRRQVLFVTGEAGIGKTTLVEAWLRQSIRRETVWLGRGQCIEHGGAGEAYLALLEALNRLCRGPRGETVIARLRQQAPGWLAQLSGVLAAPEREDLPPSPAATTARHYQRELADALEALGAEQPLVLVLEDLHWGDHSSIEALAVLARRPEPARLLVIGTYRPVELIVREHPLKALKQELQAHDQCRELPLPGLDAAAVRTYVAGCLPPEAVEPAAAAVYRRTAGQPLFMVHLTEYLAQHPKLVARGNAEALAAAADLPVGLRQFIETQLGRLNETEQQVLEAASVAGVTFSGAVVAAALDLAETEVEAVCARLIRREQFITERGLFDWADGGASEGYEFRHALYQEVLYRRIGAHRRLRLHRAIGERLEAGHGGGAATIAVELAEHFEQGREYRRAVRYHRLAGETALGRHACREALAHLRRGLALLAHWPEDTERVQEELRLQLSLAVGLIATEGFGAPSVARAYRRAYALCRSMAHQPTPQPVLCGLWNYFVSRADLRRAQLLAWRLITFLSQPPASECLLPAHNVIGQTHLFKGEPARALSHIANGMAEHDLRTHRHLADQYGEDPAVVCHMYAAWVHWLLGRPDHARWWIETGLELARRLAQPFGVAQMLWIGLLVEQGRGDPAGVQAQARDLIALCQREDIGFWLGGGRVLHGWALAELGQPAAGLAAIQEGLTDWEASGTVLIKPYYLALQAEALVRGGAVDDALEVVAEALATVQRTGERWYEAELFRLRGELRWRRGAAETATVEADWQRARTLARRQQARALELRAAASLARLWRDRGRRRDAHALLAPVYERFIEGFVTADLQSARALLDELARDVDRH